MCRHDPEKVKLLLDHGAAVPEQAVLIAAGLADSRGRSSSSPTRAKLDADREGYTPLAAALVTGDRETVYYLLAKGANVKARPPKGYTALTFASLRPGTTTPIGRPPAGKGVSPDIGYEHNLSRPRTSSPR